MNIRVTDYSELERMSNAELDALTVQDRFGPGFKRTNTNDLMAATFPPLKAIVPGYVYAGFTAFAGRMKLGKTWLAIDYAIAVATGGVAMGSIDCIAGDVLYIDLENGPRRIQSRIRALFPHDHKLPDMSRLEWVTEAPLLNDGFFNRLDRWRTSVTDPRLVVIDVLQRIKPPGNKNQNAYESDYSIWAPLQEWATRHGVAVLGLHHTKKGGADDPLEALSGSNGLSACADTTIVLDQGAGGRTLYVRGRDVEERETAVSFNAGSWTVLGEAADVRRSDERNAILGALAKSSSPLGPKEIAAATGMKDGNVRFLLGQMVAAGEIQKQGYGRYTPTNTANTPNSWSSDED
ncbi:AAA family ATPase [Bradyrhizobium elkanii]